MKKLKHHHQKKKKKENLTYIHWGWTELYKHSFHCGKGGKENCSSLSLQVEEQVIQFYIGFPMDALTHKKSQFVGILAGGRHSDDSLSHNIKKWWEKRKTGQTCYL